MAASKASIFSDRPDMTAALRHMAWIHAVEGRGLTSKEIVQRINQARSEMGLPELQKGAPITLFQKRTVGSPQRDSALPAHYQKQSRDRYLPIMNNLAWRFYAGHSHGEIRSVARNGIWLEATPDHDARFAVRGAHLPDVRIVHLGGTAPLPDRLADQLGLYLVRYPTHSYVGQTGEINVRWAQHRRAGATSGIFVYGDSVDLDLEALNVAESLAIAAFTELLQLRNGKLGRDRRPKASALQSGSAFTLMFQAVIVRLAATGRLDDTLVWRADRDVPGLREAYLSLEIPGELPEG